MTKRAYFNIDETESVRCIESSIIMTSSTKPATRRRISQQKSFRCCQQNCSENCKICHGLGTILGSHYFVRFVESIIDFKTSNRTTESHITQSIELNFSQIVRNTQKSAFHTRSYTRQSFITPMRSSCQPSKKQSIHFGIQCDKCHEYPIVGRRYNCQECQNYDLCQRCFVIHDHEHNTFEEVKQTKSQMMKERLKQKAKELNDKNMARVSRIIRTMGSLC